MFTYTCPIILASASPRRRELLHSVQLKCSVQPASIDESPRPGEQPEQYALRMAREKAASVAALNPQACVISADTVVTIDSLILGKPETTDQALDMLQQLRGKTHTVITGVTIAAPQQEPVAFAEQTSVTFAHFDDPLLWQYIFSGDPMDKAGAYGIQSKGAFLVESVNGSFTNVVGLPLNRVLTMLFALQVIQ